MVAPKKSMGKVPKDTVDINPVPYETMRSGPKAPKPKAPAPTQPKPNKTRRYNMETYGEAKPVDERKFGRVKSPTVAPAKKTRGGRFDPRLKKLTPAEQEFLRKQKQLPTRPTTPRTLEQLRFLYEELRRRNSPRPNKPGPKKDKRKGPVPMPRAIEPGGNTKPMGIKEKTLRNSPDFGYMAAYPRRNKPGKARTGVR
jgi:hypothetical protein